MIWKVIRTAKRLTIKIEQIQIVEIEDDYIIIHDYVKDGFYGDQRLWHSNLTRSEAHKVFNGYLATGYQEVSGNE